MSKRKKAKKVGVRKKIRRRGMVSSVKVEVVTEAEVKRVLDPLAKEINVRLKKAEEIEGKADDHRLAAALQLVKARDECRRFKVSFRAWTEKNVRWSWESARKLVRVGSSSDPVAALEDLRGRTAKSQKKTRAKDKAMKVTRAIATDPEAVATTAVEAMADEQAEKFLLKAAAHRGLGKAVSKVVGGKGKGKDDTLLDIAKAAFDALSALDKLQLLLHAKGMTGADISIFDQPIEVAVKAAVKTKIKTAKASKPRTTRGH